jgi:hypothetical protein
MKVCYKSTFSSDAAIESSDETMTVTTSEPTQSSAADRLNWTRRSAVNVTVTSAAPEPSDLVVFGVNSTDASSWHLYRGETIPATCLAANCVDECEQASSGRQALQSGTCLSPLGRCFCCRLRSLSCVRADRQCRQVGLKAICEPDGRCDGQCVCSSYACSRHCASYAGDLRLVERAPNDLWNDSIEAHFKLASNETSESKRFDRARADALSPSLGRCTASGKCLCELQSAKRNVSINSNVAPTVDVSIAPTSGTLPRLFFLAFLYFLNSKHSSHSDRIQKLSSLLRASELSWFCLQAIKATEIDAEIEFLFLFAPKESDLWHV